MLAGATERGGAGPYVQSQRLPLYRAQADRLLSAGHAYRCFCTPERLKALRDAQAKRGSTTLYDRACLRIPVQEAERRAALGEPHTVRFAVPASVSYTHGAPGSNPPEGADGAAEGGQLTFQPTLSRLGGGSTLGVSGSAFAGAEGSIRLQDRVVGAVAFAPSVVDDQVLLKSDGFPTYHLASVVDDHLMRMSHVIRGQEWLSSTPKHLLLYAALGWTPPAFAHLPLLLNADRSKLSKRQGDASVEDFRDGGYLPEALVNFVSLLGWTPPSSAASGGATEEAMTLEEMMQLFRLEDMNKANAIVDRARLDYFNQKYIRKGFHTPFSAPSRPSVASTPAYAEGTLPLALADTDSLRCIREGSIPAIDALLATVAAPAAAAPSARAQERMSPEALNALLFAQHERVHVFREFAPLVAPLLMSESGSGGAAAADPSSEFGRWMAKQAATAVGEKIAAAAAGNAKKGPKVAAAADAAPDSEREPAPFDPAHLVSALATVSTSIGRVANEWERMTEAEFMADRTAVAHIKAVAKGDKVPVSRVMLPVRFMLTGLDVGCGLTDTLRFLGRDRAVTRLRMATDTAHPAYWVAALQRQQSTT
jgi:hypothetical protein